MNKTFWALDDELDEAKFERLYADLFAPGGFLDIALIEPQDDGRDAEEFPRKGRSREGHPAFFQFSKEGDWKKKLRRDAKKLVARKSEFDILWPRSTFEQATRQFTITDPRRETAKNKSLSRRADHLFMRCSAELVYRFQSLSGSCQTQ